MWFLLPMVLMLFFVAAWPLLRTIYFSFTNTSLTSLYSGEWIGFDNYLSYRKLSSGRVIWRGTLVDPVWWKFQLSFQRACGVGCSMISLASSMTCF